ncbi:hypothetical protein GALL_464960 [mine drainage metagenome]|uniref:Uncharacterized protein n=1 Tax=mine drainage metagenome TaxID=410659 RepID=A0A1J5PWF4_9ZZZZ
MPGLTAATRLDRLGALAFYKRMSQTPHITPNVGVDARANVMRYSVTDKSGTALPCEDATRGAKLNNSANFTENNKTDREMIDV